MTTLTTTTTRDAARRALRTLDAVRGQLAAVLRDPDASEARIEEAVRRAAGAARALRTAEEARQR